MPPINLPSTVDQWTVIVAMFLPLVIAVINRTAWTSAQKAVAALVICIVTASIELVVKGQWSPKNLGVNALAVFFMVVTTYKGFWQPTGITDAVGKKTG